MRKTLLGDVAEVSPEFVDSMLGVLRRQPESGWWEGTVDVPAGAYRSAERLSFAIAGHDLPDDVLLANARTIVHRYAEFRVTMDGFLESEAARDAWHGYGLEIVGLVPECVYLIRPHRPDDAIVALDGGTGGRAWRCDLYDGTPENLGFDRLDLTRGADGAR